MKDKKIIHILPLISCFLKTTYRTHSLRVEQFYKACYEAGSALSCPPPLPQTIPAWCFYLILWCVPFLFLYINNMLTLLLSCSVFGILCCHPSVEGEHLAFFHPLFLPHTYTSHPHIRLVREQCPSSPFMLLDSVNTPHS